MHEVWQDRHRDCLEANEGQRTLSARRAAPTSPRATTPGPTTAWSPAGTTDAPHPLILVDSPPLGPDTEQMACCIIR